MLLYCPILTGGYPTMLHQAQKLFAFWQGNSHVGWNGYYEGGNMGHQLQTVDNACI